MRSQATATQAVPMRRLLWILGLLQTSFSSRTCTISTDRAHRQLGLNADTGAHEHRPVYLESLSKTRFCLVSGKVDESSNEAPNEGWSPCILPMHFIVGSEQLKPSELAASFVTRPTHAIELTTLLETSVSSKSTTSPNMQCSVESGAQQMSN